MMHHGLNAGPVGRALGERGDTSSAPSGAKIGGLIASHQERARRLSKRPPVLESYGAVDPQCESSGLRAADIPAEAHADLLALSTSDQSARTVVSRMGDT
jgi:hypothetical protein